MGTIKVKKDGEWVKLPNYGVEEFPDAPSDGKTYGRKNKQWSEIIASNQYLDLTTLFPNESGALSEENYQKVVDAYENRVSLARVNTVYFPFSMTKDEESYGLTINMSGLNSFELNANLVVNVKRISVYTDDKTYVCAWNSMNLVNKGVGTKYLSDNGQYREINTISGNGVSEIAALSQSAYDGLTEKKNTTLYIITG